MYKAMQDRRGKNQTNTRMKAEIAAAVWFLRNLVERAHRKPEPHKLDLFCEKLASALQKKFEGHWYPENPSKGQAFRSIRVNQFSGPDPDVLWSCQESGIESGEMIMPPELTLWVDPGEVWCRIGERNYHFLATRLSSSEQEHKVTAKMTSFKDKVMSHSHSAPSSDVERCYSSPLTVSSTDRLLNPENPPYVPLRVPPGLANIPSSVQQTSFHPSRQHPFIPPVNILSSRHVPANRQLTHDLK